MPVCAPAAPSHERIAYVDVLRLLAMYAVYVGHLAQFAGAAFQFVYLYHIPLFFFLSGGMERNSAQQRFPVYLSRKIRTILIPWLFFALTSAVIFIVSEQLDFIGALRYLLVVLQGCVVNHFFASALWFLTGLFVMSLAFFFIKKLRLPIAIIGVSLLLHLFAVLWAPSIVTSWYWNVGGVCKYMLYYALGYILFPALNRFVTNTEPRARLIFTVTALLAACYAIPLYFGKDALGYLPLPDATAWVIPILRSLLLIYCNVAAAYALRFAKPLCRAGQDTLYLCGSEFIMTLCPAVAQMFGLDIRLHTPFLSLLYAAMLMAVAFKWLVPTEKRIVASLQRRYDRLLSRFMPNTEAQSSIAPNDARDAAKGA